MKRSRGRNRRPGGNQQNAFNNPNRHFESVGPDVKIRGSAQQVLEKYQQYARDAHTSGDRVLSEAYFQYAEHYQRIVAKQAEARVQQGGQQQPQNRNGNGNGSRDDRDPRGGQDRDPRGGGNDDSVQAEQDQGEAEVVPTVTARRNEDEESDSLRVIDTDDEADDGAQASEPASETRGGASRRSRKPYRSREEGAAREDRPAREPRAPREPVEAASETDGVMKTLARGRRKSAPEESAPAETND
ncbi:MAG: DUF4167 domain-containing protein [Hyphomonas sp.]